MLCCLYLIVNFQVKTQVPLWGKYHKRKVIIRLQQVSSIRVTVVVTKIIFKLFLSVLAINKEKYKFSYYNLYMHYYFLINLSVKVANGYIYIWASNMPNDSPIQLELLKDQFNYQLWVVDPVIFRKLCAFWNDNHFLHGVEQNLACFFWR